MNGKNSTTPAHRKPSALDRLHELDELVEQHQDRDRQELVYLLARRKHHLSMTSRNGKRCEDFREALEIKRDSREQYGTEAERPRGPHPMRCCRTSATPSGSTRATGSST